MTKVIAMYLPQYHRIPENDLWWGEGYTDWKAVKDAKSLFQGHLQPRIPLDGHYYDLSDTKELRLQAELAEKYGIYGFGIYHYWFSSNQILLDTPPKLIYENKDINIHYFFMWDNGSWKRTWSNVKFSNSWAPLYEKTSEGPEILAELKYAGEEEWKKHFEYLLPFFRDERYIRINGKPLFGIFNQDNDSITLKRMFQYWNELAIENGINGIAILGRSNISKKVIADYQFDYEPCTHGWLGKNKLQRAIYKLKDQSRVKAGKLKKYEYSVIWKNILRGISKTSKNFPGAFVRYDDTPRRGKNSSIVVGDNALDFEKYMRELLLKCEKYNKEYVFLTAWNEWGEGAYLEPDTNSGYDYLEALRKAISEI